MSVRWRGKLLPPVSEVFTFYLTADDAAALAVNHSLVINATDVCCVEHRATVALTKVPDYTTQPGTHCRPHHDPSHLLCFPWCRVASLRACTTTCRWSTSS